MPSAPKTTNARRQLTNCRHHTTSSGVNAPPQRAAIQIRPWARVRSRRGSQVASDLAMMGKQPASPTPKRNRTTIIEAKFQAAPVSAVNADHIRTMRIRPLRAPTQSPNQAPGTSNRP